MFDLARRQIFPKHNVKRRKNQVDVSTFAKGKHWLCLNPYLRFQTSSLFQRGVKTTTITVPCWAVSTVVGYCRWTSGTLLHSRPMLLMGNKERDERGSYERANARSDERGFHSSISLHNLFTIPIISALVGGAVCINID